MYRKFYHFCGLIFPALILFFSRSVSIWTAGIFFVLILIFEIIRHKSKEFNLWVFRRLKWLLRPSEFHSFSGSLYFMGGVLATLVLFGPAAASGGIIILSIGDASASAAGRKTGESDEKTLKGTAAFFVFSLAALLLVSVAGLNFSLRGIFIASAVCALAEGIDMKVNDNLYLPVLGAFIFSLPV